MNTIDEHGLETTMKLLVNHTDERTAELKTAYDSKFTAMQSVVNGVSKDMDKLSASVDERVEQMHQEVSGYTDILRTISQQISDLNANVNNKIDSIRQDFDNLDTQVNNINQKLSDLSDTVDSMKTEDTNLKQSIKDMSDDISTIKGAMDSMIVNIVPNDSGQFDVYHYDGTVNHNKIVDEIDPKDIDDMLFGFDADGDNEEY